MRSNVALFSKDKYIRINRIGQPGRSLSQNLKFLMNYFPQCPGCKTYHLPKDLGSEWVCELWLSPSISAKERLALTVDPASFEEMFTGIETTDPLNFPNYKKN